MQILADALEPQNDDDDADIQSGAMFRLVRHSFLNLRSFLNLIGYLFYNLLIGDVINYVCDVITLI